MRALPLILGAPGVLLCLACGPDLPETPGSTDATSDDASTTQTTDILTPSTGEPEPTTTTGAPDGCPQGQVPFTQRWSNVLTPPFDPAFARVYPLGDIATMADGRIALSIMAVDVDAGTDGPAVLFASPEGEFLAIHMGQLTPSTDENDLLTFAMKRGADDGLVQTGTRYWLEDDEQRMASWVARFASDGTFLGQTDLVGPTTGKAALGLLATPLLFGVDLPTKQVQAVKLKPGSAEPEWTVALEQVPEDQGVFPEVSAVAPGAGGTALLVYRKWTDIWTTHLHLVDSDGASVWKRELAAPWETRDVVAIPDGWVVMTGGLFDGLAHLWAIAADDGDLMWDLELASTGGEGLLAVRNLHLTGAHLTIPVLRTPDPNPYAVSSARTIAAHRVSLQGEPIDETPLPGAASLTGTVAVSSAVDECGELIVLASGNWDEMNPESGLGLQLSGWTP